MNKKMNKKSFPSGHNPYSLEHLENNRFQCLRISLRVFLKKKIRHFQRHDLTVITGVQ